LCVLSSSANRRIRIRRNCHNNNTAIAGRQTMKRIALGILGCALLGSLVGEAAAGTVKVVELKGPVTRANGSSVQLPSQLNTGERIMANGSSASVLLECNGGATQMLTGAFDAIIAGTGDASPCAIDLKRGTAVATTSPNEQNTGASIKVGDVTLGAKGTQFGASAGDVVEAFVIEGKVAVTGVSAVSQLTTAQSVRRGDPAVRPISEGRYEYLASSYAQLSTSRANVGQAQTDALKASYLRTFRNPADADARAVLATEQYKVAPNSALQLYQQSRANHLKTTVGVYVGPPMAAVPKFNGHRVDVCKVWGMECGQPAADEWCRRNGKQRASSYRIQEDIGATEPTVVIGTGQLCNAAYCDAFSRIVCE
jgi:FecR-like protein